MLKIKFTINGEDRAYEYADSQRDVANEMVKALKEDDGCTSLLCVKADGSCVLFKKETPKCFAVQVIFNNSSKPYTYGSKYEISPNEEVIVSTYEGLKIVKCIDCKKIEVSSLSTLTHGVKPQWIKGKFTRF